MLGVVNNYKKRIPSSLSHTILLFNLIFIIKKLLYEGKRKIVLLIFKNSFFKLSFIKNLLY